MKRPIILSIAILFACLILYATSVLSQETRVQILDPTRDGTEVRKTYIVKGTASITSGTHLWVLTRREDFEGLWWPQGEGKVNPTNGEWNVSVTFGSQDDIGWNFDIAAVLVTEQDHLILRDYRNNAMRTNDWRPIELPKVVVAPVLKKVKKIGH